MIVMCADVCSIYRVLLNKIQSQYWYKSVDLKLYSIDLGDGFLYEVELELLGYCYFKVCIESEFKD